MKKSLWIVLLLAFVCIFALSACDDTNQPQVPNEDHVHAFGEWTTVKDATCTVKGEQERSCSCGEKETKSIDDTGHTEVIDAAIAPACNATGLTEGKHCSVCNAVITAQQVVAKLEHTPATDAAVESTCSATGLTEGKHCSVCNETIVAQEVVAKLEHTPVTDAAVEATCSATGLTEGSHCSVCNTIIIKQTNTAIIDHDYQDGACTMCKAVDAVAKQAEIDAENSRHQDELDSIDSFYSSTISALEQQISNLKWAYDISYTYETSYCRTLISNLTSEIAQLERRISSLSGSSYSVDIVEKRKLEAQVREKDAEREVYYKHITINNCYEQIDVYETDYQYRIKDENATHQANLETIEIKYACAANGHTVVIDEAIAPTCTTNGRTEGSHCSVCNAILVKSNTINAVGHNYEQWAVTQDATCDIDGLKTRKCSNCDKKETQVIDRLGHIGGTATCTEAAQCERCFSYYGTSLGHTGGTATCKLQAICVRCNEGYGETLDHKGGIATCVEKAVCSLCSEEYGYVDSSNHSGSTTIKNQLLPSCEKNGYTGDTYCSDCDIVLYYGSDVQPNGHDYTSTYFSPTETKDEYINYSCAKCEHNYEEAVNDITIEIQCSGMSAYGSLLRSITLRMLGYGGYGEYNYSIKVFTNSTCTTQVKELHGTFNDVTNITVDAPNNKTYITGWVVEITVNDLYNHSQITRWEIMEYKSGMSSNDLVSQIQ